MQEKDAASVEIFPPAVPLVAIFAGVALNRTFPVQFDFWLSAFDRSVVGWMVVALSVVVFGFWSVLLFRKSGQSENPWKPTTKIVEHGPYRFTRNPMYLQMILVCIGVGVALGNVWILLLTPVAVLVLVKLVIEPEEKYLEGKFGDSYLDYKKRVRRWL